MVEVIERPHIAFQGLTTLLGRPQALLQIQKPKTTGLGDISCIMAEGESREGVSVLAINMETQTVRINNVELKQTLRLGP